MNLNLKTDKQLISLRKQIDNLLETREEQKQKPQIPKKEFNDIFKETKSLMKGMKIKIPSKKFPELVIYSTVKWVDYDPSEMFPADVDVFCVKCSTDASKTVKNMINDLGYGDCLLDDSCDSFYNEITLTKEYKDFEKRIFKVLDKVEELKDKYQFDFVDDVVCKIPY